MTEPLSLSQIKELPTTLYYKRFNIPRFSLFLILLGTYEGLGLSCSVMSDSL